MSEPAWTVDDLRWEFQVKIDSLYETIRYLEQRIQELTDRIEDLESCPRNRDTIMDGSDE